MFDEVYIRMPQQEFTIKGDTALKYLMTYVAEGEDEWANALSSLKAKNWGTQETRKIIAATIILPSLDRSVIPEIPYNLLFWIRKFDQFERQDWVSKFEKILKEDEAITENRNKLVILGCIDPIEYAPYPRQALRWLVEKSKEKGDYTPEVETKFRSLIHVYGGISISDMFSGHRNKIENLPNWRSHYFFEKALCKIHSFDKLVEVKKLEIEKTNKSLVKKI
jgi:hypothetical protein